MSRQRLLSPSSSREPAGDVLVVERGAGVVRRLVELVELLLSGVRVRYGGRRRDVLAVERGARWPAGDTGVGKGAGGGRRRRTRRF